MNRREASYNQINVPLSEREQRILEEIEKGLYEEDPRFARGVAQRSPIDAGVRRARTGVGLFFAGLVLLVVFFVSRSLPLGVVAFGSMVAGIVLFVRSMRVLAASVRNGVGRRSDDVLRFFSLWQERLRRRYRGR